MNGSGKVNIGKLPTGVPGLDAVLGGGLPEFSFNILAGAPGTGENICPKCSGSGVRDDGGRCEHCGGTGKAIEGVGGGVTV